MKNPQKLTSREVQELGEAIRSNVRITRQITAIREKAMIEKIDLDNLWDLKNQVAEIEAILYNVHHGVYRS